MSRKKPRETLVLHRKKKQKYPQPLKEDDKKLTRVRNIFAKNESQQMYMNSFDEATIIFGIGSAGTGKTFIATYMAVKALLNSEIDKIVVCRPVVEAGEKLGFLPGTLDDKIHPYLLPLLDAFNFFLGPKMTQEMMKTGIIEVAPLAFMRGRTFSNCLTADQTVMLSDGTHIRIDSLVERYENGEEISVKSFNLSKECVEDSPISYAFKQPNTKRMIKVTLEDGTELKITEDHKLYVDGKGYIEAGSLQMTDELMEIDN